MLLLFLILLSLRDVQSCASLGSGTDSQLFQNPTLQWTMNPPTSWTYPVTYAQITQQYFPGQPLTQADATNQADGDMTAAVLEALANNNLPTQNVKIVSNYQPQMVSDCVKVAGTAPIPTATKSGDMFGIAEQGAITQIATATADLAIADCAARTFKMETFQPYIVSASLSIEGLTLSGLQLKQIVAGLQSQLNFNNRVRLLLQIESMTEAEKSQTDDLVELVRLSEPPPRFEFMANPSTINDFELNLLRLTAMFVARNGRDFLLKLMTRESNNSLFDFMKPQHHGFPYFTNLVEQYTKIIVPAKTVTQDLEKSTDYDALLKSTNYRSAWEKHQGSMKERQEKAAEEELKAYQLIDWHDFVIVNTIEFDDE